MRKRRSIFLVILLVCLVLAVFLFFKAAIDQGSSTREASSENRPKNRQLNKKATAYNGKQEKKITKVVLVTQARGGSTFLGELFNKNPDACYWYESGAAIYQLLYGNMLGPHPVGMHFHGNGSLRIPTTFESFWVPKLILKLLSGDMDNLPQYFWYNRLTLDPKVDWLRPLEKCVRFRGPQFLKLAKEFCGEYIPGGVVNVSVESLCYDIKQPPIFDEASLFRTVFPEKQLKKSSHCKIIDRLLQCHMSHILDALVKKRQICEKIIKSMARLCKTKTITVIKTTRLRLREIKSILDIDPSVKVIYYLRDPRGIIHSRINIPSDPDLRPSSAAGGSWMIAAKLLCDKLRDDIEVLHELKGSYSKNVISLRYEDFVKDIPGFGRKVYSFIGKNMPEKWCTWYTNSMRNSSKYSVWNTHRNNPVATSIEWRNKLNTVLIRNITEQCKEVLTTYGYEL